MEAWRVEGQLAMALSAADGRVVNRRVNSLIAVRTIKDG